MPLKALQTVGQRSVAVVLRFAVKDVPSLNGDVEGDFTQINKTKKLCSNNKQTTTFPITSATHQSKISTNITSILQQINNKSHTKVSPSVVPSTTPGLKLPNHVQPNVLPNPGIQWPAGKGDLPGNSQWDPLMVSRTHTIPI